MCAGRMDLYEAAAGVLGALLSFFSLVTGGWKLPVGGVLLVLSLLCTTFAVVKGRCFLSCCS